MTPHAYIDPRYPNLLRIYITDITDADEDGSSPQTDAAFRAAPRGTADYGDSRGETLDQYGGWTYTLRLPRPLYGAAVALVERCVTAAVRAVEVSS